MRIRRKKWAKEELEQSEIYIHNPDVFKGIWKKKFKNKEKPIHIELGCGKGQFVSKIAKRNKDINYIAVDMIEAMLGLANRNIIKEIGGSLYNVLVIRKNVDNISETFAKKDGIERIYINFCNPWPRTKHNKRRLVHPRKLEMYKEFLVSGGEIYFKTDSDELFEDALEYFKQSGFKILKKTYDLEKQDIFEGNIETEHEQMFKNEGIKIKALIAKEDEND